MNRQNGMATLAVVSGVLLIAALFAISVASSGFADIKKAQNLVLDAKQRAKAKAGLDCAIAVFKQNRPDSPSLNDRTFVSTLTEKCSDKTSGEFSISGVGGPWELVSSSGFAKYGVTISLGSGIASAFKTSGSLVIEGGNSWVPAKGNLVGKDGDSDVYECLAIVAGGDVTIDTGNSTAAFESQLLESNKEQCKEGYSTSVALNTRKVNDFDKDILYQQPDMELFKDKFNEPKSNWEKVKGNFDTSFSTSGFTTVDKETGEIKSNVELCGKTITQKRRDVITEQSHTDGELVTIWVDGDCDLAQVESDINNPVFIVVKDGVISYSGALANFNGSIFQFNYERENFLDSWLDVTSSTDDEGNTTTSVSCTNGPMATFCDLFNEPEALGMDPDNWKHQPFLFYGSFETKGSYIVDVEDGTSKVFGSFKPGYDESIDKASSLLSRPKIIKGSIHDF